jgi:hypothetical protein
LAGLRSVQRKPRAVKVETCDYFLFVEKLRMNWQQFEVQTLENKTRD